MSLFGAVMLALYDRERSGVGRKVSSSLLANGLWANAVPLAARLAGAEVSLETPRNEMDNALAIPYGTRDGHWFYPWLFNEERDWLRFAEALGLGELGSDARFAETPARRANARALIEAFEARIGAEDWSHWKQLMAERGIDLIAVATLDEVLADPQVVENAYLLPLTEPLGEARHTIASPLCVEGVEKRAAGPAPALGQHTDEVLRELGFGD
jgi:crotonobetainyl-CoA:carnitine CoA-transferase CaiB-like acyl-CoA transferase